MLPAVTSQQPPALSPGNPKREDPDEPVPIDEPGPGRSEPEAPPPEEVAG
ncbi:hypothetical protein B597_011500 [Stutzerimonas stutzeri KOS6]|uniref:Uncharacterized protein n=1 Tax=Stutzerimonas stutzeri KOS6 TaxID=1218352 RepID=A0A061JMT1_STUST|nr:hypothetical protein B597_011500 [Stutzerimonas stutzeri KOS6]